ncbi:hypothetical protein V2W45_737674 [Cenococcum geophilum]
MASPERAPSSTHHNSHLKLPVKRSLSGECVRPNPQYANESSSNQPSLNQPSFPLRNSSRSSALGIAYANEQYQCFLRKYSHEDIIKGHELAKHEGLFDILRNYDAADIYAALRFAEDGALDFFDAFKKFLGSEVLECKRAVFDNSEGPPDTWRDSGYDSRPPSELRYSTSSTTLPANLPGTSQSFAYPSFTRHAQQQDSLLINEVANPDSSPGPVSDLRRLQPFNSPHHLHTPYDPPTGSTSHSPGEITKNSQSREFECTYCIKEFVRPGDCLNHEDAYHRQEKKWICPHCVFQAETKNGCLRHHRLAHHCQSCGLKERVEILSKPKTACACPYCGRLFEGNASFNERSSHVNLTHYKGDEPKRRSDLDHTKMILSLLCCKELSGPWKIFISKKSKRSLTWTPEKARAIIPELEKGIFPNGVHYMLQKVYDMSTEASAQPDKSQECTEPCQSSNSTTRFPIHPALFASDCSFDPPAHVGAGMAPLNNRDLPMQSLPERGSADLGITAINNTSSDPSGPSSHPKSNGASGSQHGITYRHPAVLGPHSSVPFRKLDRPPILNHTRHLRQDVFMGSDNPRAEPLPSENPRREGIIGNEAVLVPQPAPYSRETLDKKFVRMRDVEKCSTAPLPELGIGSDPSTDSFTQGLPPASICGTHSDIESRPPASPLPWPPHRRPRTEQPQDYPDNFMNID